MLHLVPGVPDQAEATSQSWFLTYPTIPGQHRQRPPLQLATVKLLFSLTCDCIRLLFPIVAALRASSAPVARIQYHGEGVSRSCAVRFAGCCKIFRRSWPEAVGGVVCKILTCYVVISSRTQTTKQSIHFHTVISRAGLLKCCMLSLAQPI